MSKELGVDLLDENPFSFKKFMKTNVTRSELESESGCERSQIAPDPIDFHNKDDSDLDIFNLPANTTCNVKNEHLGFDDALIAFKENKSLLFIQQLQEENRELRQQLLKTRAVACRESARAKQLLKDTDSAHKYEMDETAALEKMIQQVEGNLQATLQRAIYAENSIIKLKQEIKTLKSFSSSLVIENEMLKSENCNSLKEKSTFAAEQITAAITNAEQLLKQLLSGVDNLKMVAKVLSSVDQIKDIPLDEVTDQ